MSTNNVRVPRNYDLNIVAAIGGMHVSPAKHSYARLPRKCDYWIEGRIDGQTDAGQSHPYVPLCLAGESDIKTKTSNVK